MLIHYSLAKPLVYYNFWILSLLQDPFRVEWHTVVSLASFRLYGFLEFRMILIVLNTAFIYRISFRWNLCNEFPMNIPSLYLWGRESTQITVIHLKSQQGRSQTVKLDCDAYHMIEILAFWFLQIRLCFPHSRSHTWKPTFKESYPFLKVKWAHKS